MIELPRTTTVATPDAASLLAELSQWGQKLGLERIAELLERLGCPQLETPHVLVAGTNGKGSTSVVLASILRAAGYRTGLYTSPHLEDVRERIRLQGRVISAADLGRTLGEVLSAGAAAGDSPPTYFEALTASAWVYFRQQQADVAVVEVGLGGRLDATNASDPLLSIVTSIAHDHTEHLGSSLGAIAAEKCAIMRPGRPALTWLAPRHRARKPVADLAARIGAVHEEVTRTVATLRPSFDAPIVLSTPRSKYSLQLALPGHHQLGNVALAVRAAEVLAEQLGFSRIDREAITEGVARVVWPGRLERVLLPPFGSRRPATEVLLDGAHNVAGARALAAALVERGEVFDLLFGALRGPRRRQVLPLLLPHVEAVTLTRPDSDRAAEPASWLPLVAAYEHEHEHERGAPVLVEPVPMAALTAALSRNPRRLLVTGSLYLVGAIRAELWRRFGCPTPCTEMEVG